MMELLARGMNIYYRGYVIHEDIRHIHYTIYGQRPHRRELACVGGSREAMRWVDRDISAGGPEILREWPALFPGNSLPAVEVS